MPRSRSMAPRLSWCARAISVPPRLETTASVAKGEFLAFLDADDVWHPDKIARQMARFAARPELQLCLCMQRPFWEPEMRHEETRLRAEGHLFAKDHAGYVCQAMLMPRATFELVGEFNEALRVGEDTDWLIRAKVRSPRRCWTRCFSTGVCTGPI